MDADTYSSLNYIAILLGALLVAWLKPDKISEIVKSLTAFNRVKGGVWLLGRKWNGSLMLGALLALWPMIVLNLVDMIHPLNLRLETLVPLNLVASIFFPLLLVFRLRKVDIEEYED